MGWCLGGVCVLVPFPFVWAPAIQDSLVVSIISVQCTCPWSHRRCVELEYQDLSLSIQGGNPRQSRRIPSDPYIRLSDYLACVAGTDHGNDIPAWLRNWQSLTRAESHTDDHIRQLLGMAARHSPDGMRDSGSFVIVSDESIRGCRSQFLKISRYSPEI